MSLEHLSGTSRLWTFLANRPLNSDEQQALSAELSGFVNGWQAHGRDLAAGFDIRFQALVLVAVDESREAPSGCSIDKAFRLLQDFGLRQGLDFFQRTLVAVPANDGAVILTKDAAREAYQSGQINDQTPVVNTMVPAVELLDTELVIPFSRHWLGRQLTGEHAGQ